MFSGTSLVARRAGFEVQRKACRHEARTEDETDSSPKSKRHITCSPVRKPSAFATVAGAGVFIWLYCVLFADDLFSSDFWASSSGSVAFEGTSMALSSVVAELSAEAAAATASAEAEVANMLWDAHMALPEGGKRGQIFDQTNLSNGHAGANGLNAYVTRADELDFNATKGDQMTLGRYGSSYDGPWLVHRASSIFNALNMTHLSAGHLSHLHGVDLELMKQKWNSTKSLASALGWNTSHSLSKALSRLPEINVSSDLIRRGAEHLRKEGQKLQLRGEAKLRQKQEELRIKQAQVHNASMALVGAISSGQVQQNVIIGIVGVFVSVAIVLQILSSLRGDLRQWTRQFLISPFAPLPASNELVTRPYAGWIELFVRATLDFLNEPANVMLMSIGSMQVMATWSKADPLKCKKVNLLVLLLNLAYTFVLEIRAQMLAAKHDATWNLKRCFRICDLPSDEHNASGLSCCMAHEIFAKDIEIDDVIRLRFGDICPATGKLIQTSHSFLLFNSLCETGEDCCSVFAAGSTILRGFILATADAEVHIQITETRNMCALQFFEGRMMASAVAGPKSRRMERFPEHMNKPLTIANLAGLAVLFVGAVLVSALNYGSTSAFGNSSSYYSLSPSERLLVTHFFSTVVQLNTLIPSMRWVVLFFFYIFLIEVTQPQVHIQNWRAFQGLQQRSILYSDKTGTLTEVGMHVARLRVVATGADLTPSRGEGCVNDVEKKPSLRQDSLPWLVAMLMACNDCQAVPCSGGDTVVGRRPGTSPEEMAIAEHLEHVLGIVIRSNPLQPGTSLPAENAAQVPMHKQPLVICCRVSGTEIAHGEVLVRGDFDSSQGCREAQLSLSHNGSHETWIVRQGGADIMASLAGCASRETELAAEDRDRALGWSVARVGADGSRIGAWRYILRASFRNPPRSASAPMVAHCLSAGVAVRILTGDAAVAALHIAREVGVLGSTNLCAYEVGESLNIFVARLCGVLLETTEGICVAVPGAVVRQLIEANNGLDSWLADDRISAIIYRTRAADKAFIVQRTEELGREKHFSTKSMQAHCIPASAMQLQCMGLRQKEKGVCIMMGDAANDAEAIGLEDVVGLSLRHGAAPCKLNADFIVDGPGALIAIRTELHTRALVGARWLLEDVCFLCGFVSALTFCGVWAASFVFLPRGFLYDDPFDARIMTLFSSCFYSPSACAAACAAAERYSSSQHDPRTTPMLFFGVLLGFLLGLAGPSDDLVRFGRWILSATSTVCFLRHASAEFLCTSSWFKADENSISRIASPALDTQNTIAKVLARLRTPLVRSLTLGFYLLLVWL